MGLNWAEHTVEIAAPIGTCFEAITDYETFASWQSAVVDTEVLDWDAKGRGKRVRLFVDAKVRKVDYTLDYRYDEPERIEWDFVEGNGINDADGHYLFEDLGGDRTRATYKLGLEVGIPLPGPVARRAHKSTLKASVEDLKREAERRAASSAQARDDDPSKQRESKLAEEVGIKRRERRAVASATPESTEEWGADGSHSVAELPGLLVGGAASLGRRVAGGGARAAREVTEGAASAGVGVARRAVDAGRGVADAVTGRAARLLGRGSDRADHYPH
jgi:uncharacterized membrane protein